MIAIDASALLAFMFREPGHELVEDALDDGCISAVNVSEVIGRFVQDGHDGGVVLERIQSTAIEVVPFRAADAALAASLVPGTRPHGLSLADRACLALALARGVPAMTADRVWAELDVGVRVQVVR